MRWFFGGSLGLLASLLLSVPVLAATEAPQTEEGLPVALIVAGLAGLLVFGYFLIRPWRITGGKD